MLAVLLVLGLSSYLVMEDIYFLKDEIGIIVLLTLFQLIICIFTAGDPRACMFEILPRLPWFAVAMELAG